MIKYIDNIDWQLLIAILLIGITIVSKYRNSLIIKQKSYPVWCFCFGITLFYCWLANYITLLGVLSLGVMLLVSLAMGHFQALYIRVLSASVAALIFLAMGFHLLPGFNNQLLIESQVIKDSSSSFTAWFNFDKTFAGLIFFLTVVSGKGWPSQKQVAIAFFVILFTIILVLAGGQWSGLVSFNTANYFDFRFLVLFITLQLISACLAEEVFFRGFIQQKLYGLFKRESIVQKTVPLIITSILFGMAHFGGGIIYMIAASFAGLGYGLIYQVTKRIEYSILAHALFNIIHLLLFTYPLLSETQVTG